MNILENEHIKLRAPEPEDLDFLYKWENDSNNWDVADTNEPLSKYLIKRYIAYSDKTIYEKKQQRLIIELQNQKLVVGCIDLYDFEAIHKRAGIGIVIDEKYRKHGFAFEAVSVLKNYAKKYLHLHQLYCYISTDNEASINLFKKADFKTSGELKEWIKTSDNQYTDVVILTHLL